jgi:hypothetical protein
MIILGIFWGTFEVLPSPDSLTFFTQAFWFCMNMQHIHGEDLAKSGYKLYMKYKSLIKPSYINGYKLKTKHLFKK